MILHNSPDTYALCDVVGVNYNKSKKYSLPAVWSFAYLLFKKIMHLQVQSPKMIIKLMLKYQQCKDSSPNMKWNKSRTTVISLLSFQGVLDGQVGLEVLLFIDLPPVADQPTMISWFLNFSTLTMKVINHCMFSISKGVYSYLDISPTQFLTYFLNLFCSMWLQSHLMPK